MSFSEVLQYYLYKTFMFLLSLSRYFICFVTCKWDTFSIFWLLLLYGKPIVHMHFLTFYLSYKPYCSNFLTHFSWFSWTVVIELSSKNIILPPPFKHLNLLFGFLVWLLGLEFTGHSEMSCFVSDLLQC